MRSRTGASLCFAVLVTAGARPATAQLWRNGSFDGFGGLNSAHIGQTVEARTYDNFTVSGSGWHITSLYGEFLTDFVPEFAYWEIRSGVTKGLGGTMLHSVTSAVTDFEDLGDFDDLNYLAVRVGGFSPIDIGPGNYWLTIALIGKTGQAYVGTTDGLGGINAVTDLKYFFDSPTFQSVFTDDVPEFGVLTDFAYGLDGSEIVVTPEPATLMMLGTGVGILGLVTWRRQRRNA